MESDAGGSRPGVAGRVRGPINREVIRFGREICGNLEEALRREWLETNGLGGFASSTIAGINTRRYHGLLIAATRPPVGRVALLSKLEETLVIGGRRFDLASNRYPGVVHPRGYQYLREFRLDPFPVLTFLVEGVELEKRIFMVHGENSTVVEYELRNTDVECILEIRPLIAFRDYHSTTRRNDALNPEVVRDEGLATVRPYRDLPALHFSHNGVELEPGGDWYYNFQYDVEAERGLDSCEDLFSPFVVRFALGPDRAGAIIASTEPRDASTAAVLCRAEIERRTRVLAASPCDHPLVRALVAAADQFLVRRGDLSTVIAGYHWFGDWGRDTMIALPGLTLATGRFETARSILLAFAASVDRGMLPNRFPEAGETPEYNTVDATLWFFEAVRALAHYTGETAFVRDRLYETLKEIVEWHVGGTRYGIRCDDDGLLVSGEPGVQLTWMDAKVGDWVVTPRRGKPVEIQALWYNALRIMEDLARAFGDDAARARYSDLANRARDSFNRLFWNDQTGCLHDVVDGGSHDGTIRPNQIFAVSLPHAMLPAQNASQVVDVVRRELLTPFGLRSLSPRDSQYRPRYEGGVWSRDAAYHQGTVWPWLMGPFLTAYVKVHGGSASARQQATGWLEAFHGHLGVAGLGQISEIADGDPPHTPRGSIAQAWSVAELLRAAVEDVFTR